MKTKPDLFLKENEVPQNLRGFIDLRSQHSCNLYGATKSCVEIICPSCGKRRLVSCSKIRAGTRRTPYCRSCLNTTVGSPKRKPLRPEEVKEKWRPYFDFENQRVVKGMLRIKASCPICKTETWRPSWAIRKDSNPFCYGHKNLFKRRMKKRVSYSNYWYLHISCLGPEDRKLALQMKPNDSYIAEHRFIIAKLLKRPLKKGEIVHHKDGDGLNNEIENLQLLLTKTHHSGKGNFYHEWQAALSEIEKLKKLLEKCNIKHGM